MIDSMEQQCELVKHAAMMLAKRFSGAITYNDVLNMGTPERKIMEKILEEERNAK